MIKYKHQIELDLRRNGEWQINTDRGDVYKTLTYSNITQWWNVQCQNEFRVWQKDIVVAMTTDIFGSLTLFQVFKPGQGYNQDHDVCLVNNSKFGIWVLSTLNDFWICQSQGGNIIFNRKDSLGSIEKSADRQLIYSIYDNLKKEFNPHNLCQAVRY